MIIQYLKRQTMTYSYAGVGHFKSTFLTSCFTKQDMVVL